MNKGNRAKQTRHPAGFSLPTTEGTDQDMIYKIGQRVRRYKDLGTVVDVTDEPNSPLFGYIVQMDRDEPGAVIMAPGYLIRPAT